MRKKSSRSKSQLIKNLQEEKANLEIKAAQNQADLAAIKEKKGKNNRTQIILGVILTLGMTVLIVSLFLSFDNIQKIGETFANIAHGYNWLYLLSALALLLIYFFLWPLSLVQYSRALGIRAKNTDIFLIGASEHFYNDVTPSATGGQPFQIYAMRSVDVDTGKATGAVLATYATYLIVTNIYAFVALVFFPYFIKGIESSNVSVLGWQVPSDAFIWIIAVGYAMNTFNLILTLLLGISTKVRNLIIGAALLLSKLKLFGKIIRKQLPHFMEYCRNSQMAFKEITTHRHHFLKAFIARFAAMGAYYAIPFFLILAFGLPIENVAVAFFAILFGTSFAITAVCWLPTPGTAGGIEIVFAVVLNSLAYMPNVIQSNFDISSISFDAIALMWRLFTYYLIIILSLAVSILFQVRVQHRLREEKDELSKEEGMLSEETKAIPQEQMEAKPISSSNVSLPPEEEKDK